VRDLTGAIQVWIESAARTPRGCTRREGVASCGRLQHKDPAQCCVSWMANGFTTQSIEVARSIETAGALVERLDRRMTFALSLTDAHVFVTFPDGATVDGP